MCYVWSEDAALQPAVAWAVRKQKCCSCTLLGPVLSAYGREIELCSENLVWKSLTLSRVLNLGTRDLNPEVISGFFTATESYSPGPGPFTCREGNRYHINCYSASHDSELMGTAQLTLDLRPV